MKICLQIACYIVFSIHSLSAQKYEVSKDTVFFINNSKKVQVVNTYITHYYYLDKVCIKLIGYPQISGLKNRLVQMSINREFSTKFSFDDCDGDKECQVASTNFGDVRASYKIEKVHFIKKDLMSLIVTEGNCLDDKNYCIEKPKFIILDLQTGNEVRQSDIFKKDFSSDDELKWLVVQEIGIIPTHIDNLIEKVNLYFDDNFVYFNYEKDVLDNEEGITLMFPYAKLTKFINPKSPMARLWIKQPNQMLFEKNITLLKQ